MAASSPFPGPGWTARQVCVWGSSGAGRCRRPGHAFPHQQHGLSPQDATVKLLPPQKPFPSLSLCQAQQRAPWSRSEAGNMARATFSRSVLSGHVSERQALGQTDGSCPTASCCTTAPADGPVRPSCSLTLSMTRAPGEEACPTARGWKVFFT